MKQNKGITLIALVITIIVLLMLAGVALNVVLDPTDIIGKAEEAKTETGLQTEKENIELATLFAVDMPEEKINTALLEEQLSNVEGLNIEKGTEIWTITSEKTGAIYEVNIGTGKILNEIAEDVAVDENPGTLETVETNTYEINSIEDLVALAYNVNTGANTYSGATVTLGRNLYFDGSFNSYAEPEAKYELSGTNGYIKSETAETTLKSLLTSGIGFVPIGASNKLFEGNFDGNGNYLNGIFINTNGYAGLFGYINSEITISNLGMKNGKISSTYPAGGIIGNASNVTVTNCYSTAKILGKAPTGGIVGYVTNATITNCYNTGDVSSTSNPAGGIIGQGTGTITNCYNTGDISSSVPTGGIVGSATGVTIINCYNTGDVSSTSNPAGGIIGQGTGTITNCYNTGDISSSVPTGGIVGSATGVTIINCYNTGDVSSISWQVGGIIGSGSGAITNCYNTGNITSGFFEDSHVGGIMGETSSTTSITKCYNAGTLTSGINSTGNIYAAGSATVTDCGERTINDFLTIFNAYVTTNNSDATKTELKSWTIKKGDLYFGL